MVASVVCGMLLAAGDDSSIGDEMSLLQADVVVKAQQRAATPVAKASAAVPRAGEAAAASDSFCEVGPVSGAGDAAAQGAEVPAEAEAGDVAVATATLQSVATLDVASAPALGVAGPLPAQPRSAFAGILEVLIVLIVLDGCRRWQALQKEEKSKGPKIAGDTTNRSNESCGWEDLMQAALEGDALRTAKALRKVPYTKLSHADVWGCTALHAAAKGGSGEAVQMLLERGATADDRDAWDETPLHLAARAGQAAACEALLAFGADADALNAQDWTPLVVAADAGHKQLCSMLLARGAGVAGLSQADLPFLLRGLLSRGSNMDGGDDDDVVFDGFDIDREVYVGECMQ